MSLNKTISGLIFFKPNIPALQYGRGGKHTDIKLSSCGLFVDETLPYVAASPDVILLRSCCEKVWVEIKCPYSINYKKPCYSDLEYLQLCDGKIVENVP